MAVELTYHYSREKFWQAVHVLVGDGSIQERLAGAAMYLTRLHGPDEDLPEGQREEFRAVMNELTKEKAIGDEGNIQATTRKLSSEDGAKLAKRILNIYTELHGGI
jgi:hypothetical protein